MSRRNEDTYNIPLFPVERIVRKLVRPRIISVGCDVDNRDATNLFETSFGANITWLLYCKLYL